MKKAIATAKVDEFYDPTNGYEFHGRKAEVLEKKVQYLVRIGGRTQWLPEPCVRIKKWSPLTLGDVAGIGHHNYTLPELAANLRAYGLTVPGEAPETPLSGPQELIKETRAHVLCGAFLADWDS